jgi:hypothetical protein
MLDREFFCNNNDNFLKPRMALLSAPETIFDAQAQMVYHICACSPYRLVNHHSAPDVSENSSPLGLSAGHRSNCSGHSMKKAKVITLKDKVLRYPLNFRFGIYRRGWTKQRMGIEIFVEPLRVTASFLLLTTRARILRPIGSYLIKSGACDNKV